MKRLIDSVVRRRMHQFIGAKAKIFQRIANRLRAPGQNPGMDRKEGRLKDFLKDPWIARD